jgi:hypothetical protein
MKLHTGINVVEKSGEQESHGFSIEASAKAFFILSDGLYSNKVKAVVRELSTNAYDSHVDQGVADKPFDVHVPTRLDPTFYVRDYGTSMSHEDCMQLYTTYFRSTRNDSNDAVGCLGLGSKAPFAYVDSFTVEAYLDGTRRLYTAYKDESGCPVFSLMDECETSEPNGIKVSLSVDKYDIHDFHREAQEIFKFFKVRPNFVGAAVDFQDGTISLSGSHWEFEKGSYENYLIMGQISYPIDSDQIKDDVAHKFLYASGGLNIYANIGDVDITPSRESLSYNSATKAKITEIVNEIGLEIATSMEEQISGQENLFRARMKYIELSNQCDSVSVAMNALDTNLSWNGQDLFKTMIGSNIETGKVSVSHYHKTSWRKKIDINHGLEKIHFRRDTKFIVNDLKRGGISRIRKLMNDSDSSASASIYVFTATDMEDDPDAASSFYELLGGATEEDVILTSSLPKREYNRSGGGGGLAVQAQVYNHDEGCFEVCSMSVKYEDAHYFEESRGDVTFAGGYCGQGSLSEAISTLDSLGYDLSEYTFYLVKPSVIVNRNLEERDNWTKGDAVIVEAIRQVKNENFDNLIKVENQHELSNNNGGRWREVFALTETDCEAKKIMCEYDEYMEEINVMKTEMRTLRRLIMLCNSVEKEYYEAREKLPDVDENEKFAVRFDKEIEKYPMLEHVRGWYLEQDQKIDCAKYIDLVEKCSDKQPVSC